MDLQRTTERAPGRDAGDPVVALACELVRCPSVTPEDAGCQAMVARRLEPLGFRCESIASGGVTNLWARRGNAAPLVCFAGHPRVIRGALAAQRVC